MKSYVKPEISIEEFSANQFVATCGKKDGKYIFTCDATAGTVYVIGNHGTYKLGGYHPCTKKHETEGTSLYFDGFVDRNGNGKKDVGEEALIWAEGGREYYHNGWLSQGWRFDADDWHASASLTREQIDVERS